jgi:hypothetical protein
LTSNQTQLKPIRITDYDTGHRSKPIAHCKPKFKLPNPVNPASTVIARASTAASTFQGSDILDVAMEDITEGDREISGVLQTSVNFEFCCSRLVDPSECLLRRMLVPRDFEDLLPAEEDINPSDSSGNDLLPVIEAQNPPQHRIRRVLLTLRDSLQTAFNVIGLCRQYPRRPSFEPDKFVPSSLLAKSCPTTAEMHDTQRPDPPHGVSEPPYPFPNMSIYRLITWMNSGSHQKSEAEVTSLVKDVLQAEDFSLKDLNGFSVKRSLRALDNVGSKATITFPDDWIEADVNLEIPTKSKDDQSRSFNVPGFHYRPLIAVIRSAFADIQVSAFHLIPFKRLWKDPLDNHQERVFDELYTSDSWIEAQDDLQSQSREPGCSLERVIAGLMFFSDATHLANFGTAKAWPLYLYFGNLTKYARSVPKSGACHLVGFLPSVCCSP